MQTIVNPRETENQQNAASACAQVKLVSAFGGIEVQELRRTYGEPRELGAGARRAIHRFGDALERLAE
jgi:hypothetical protein